MNLQDLVHVKDLISYDGPLLSWYLDSLGNDVFFVWCDRTDTVNKWIVFDVYRKNLYNYLKGKMTLRKLLKDKNQIYRILELNNNLEVVEVSFLDKVPKKYLPAKDSLYEI